MTRRQFTAEQKMQIVREIVETGNVTLVARRNGIRDTVIRRWHEKYRQQGEAAFRKSTDLAKPTSLETAEMRALARENEQLKRLIGEKELELAIVRDLLKKTDRGCLKS